MKYFKKDDNSNKLICLLCQHYCKLSSNQIGICGVNKNTGSKIENLVYGYISAINLDPIEKKPLYHFLPSSKSLSIGTVGCNFKCPFCQNHSISQSHNIDKSNYLDPKQIVQLAQQYQAQSISYTYNEPTIFYPYIKDIASIAKQNNLKNIMVSNGFQSSEVIQDMVGLIDAINVDLKSFDKAYYKKYLGGNLDKLLNNLRLIKELGIWLEITTLIIPTHNDSDEELTNIAKFIHSLGDDTIWHISAFHPDFKETSLPNTSIDTLKRAYNIGKNIGLKYIYIGNINYTNNTICECGEVLIQREGFRVIKNNLINSKCPRCNKELEGVKDINIDSRASSEAPRLKIL